MSYSLRRVLAARFSLTMFVALSLIASWAALEAERSLRDIVGVARTPDALADANSRLLLVMLGIVVLGTLATAFGAYWLARSAVQPVNEMADQARRMPADVRGARITAHADVAEYAGLVSVLNGLLARTEDAFLTQRRFIADVSHELRTPLTSLQGQLEVALRAERSPRDYQVVLGNALEETQHLARMCDSLLLITRAESGALVASRGPVDLAAMTRALFDKARRRIEEKGLVVSIDYDQTGSNPPLDARLVERSLAELVDNAIKFSPREGEIDVGVRTVPDGVVWWIQDAGPGIPAEDLPRLFEAFYRVDPARSRDGGSGLGLTLAASVARVHAGSVKAENVQGGGARFTIFFPAV